MYQSFEVFIIDEAEERRTALRKEVGGWLSVVGEASSPQEAYNLAQEIGPDALLLFVEEPLARSLRNIETLSVALPEYPIIAVSTKKDQEVWRKAVLAGARDVLSLPLRQEEVAVTVQALTQQGEKKRLGQSGAQPNQFAQGTVISVFGPKGGVGKSTLAVNLGVRIASSRHRTLLIDQDTQVGAASIMLDLSPKKSLIDLAHNMRHLDREMLQAFVTSHSSGLDVLAAPLALQPDENMLTPEEMAQLLGLLANHYDYLIVDMPPQFQGAAFQTLRMSTYILLVTSLEVTSIQACKKILDVIGSWEFAKDKIKVVVNTPNSANSLGAQDVAEVLGYPVFWSLPHDVRVAEASQMGQPVVQAHPNSKAAQAMEQLHYTLVGVDQPRSKGLRAFFRGRTN